jgi:hypothetical protein
VYPGVEQQWLALQWRAHHDAAHLRHEESRLTDRSDSMSEHSGHGGAPNPFGDPTGKTPSPGAGQGGADGGYFGGGAVRAAAVWRAGVAAVKARIAQVDSSGNVAVRSHVVNLKQC